MLTTHFSLPNYFFPFVFVVAEKGSGDIASIDWCSDMLPFPPPQRQTEKSGLAM